MFKNNTYRSNTVFHTLLLVFALLLSTSLIIARQSAHTATAAPSTYLNFQARLKTSSGSVVPDGFYNIEFKLYSASSGGSALWTETRTGANVVRVANGYFTVSLGSVTAFPGNIDWSQQHWITMNIGGTGSPTWDGEMNPRLLLTAVPHAFHADRASALSDGTNDYTHNDFIKIAPGALQGTTSTASAVRINQTGSGGLLQLQSAGSDVFTISNSGQTTVRNTSSSAFRVQNGAGTTSTLLVDTTNNRVGIGTDSIGSGIDLQVGNSSGNVHVALAPANNGTSIIDFDGGSGANNIVYEDADGRISMRANGGALQVNYEGVRINRNLYIGTESGTDTLLVLDNKTTSGDVAGATNGAMYYNAAAGKFRCYEGGVWKDCISTSNIGDITQGGNSFGATMAIGTNDEEDLVLKTNNSTRLTITSAGAANFSGVVTATQFSGSGAGLTNLNASSISTGTLAIARGGTGATTAQAAINNISGLTTTGDLLYRSGTNVTRLARGSNGQCLTSNTSTILWGSCGVGSIGSFSTTNNSATGATISGGQIIFQAASATAPGMVSVDAQTFAGDKTFNGVAIFNGNVLGISLFVNNAAVFNGMISTNDIVMSQSEAGVKLTLGRKTTSGDPAGTNGAMYYNTTANKFRCYEGGAWKDCITTAGFSSIGAIDSVAKSANGASVSGDSIILQTADETNPGLVSTGSQTFAGDKTFNGGVEINGASPSTGDAPLALKVQGGAGGSGTSACMVPQILGGHTAGQCGYSGGGTSIIGGQGAGGLVGTTEDRVMGGAGGEIFIEGGTGGDVSGPDLSAIGGKGGDVVIQGGVGGLATVMGSEMRLPGDVYLARDRGEVYVGGALNANGVLNITGYTKLGTLGTASSTHLCYIASGTNSGRISTCSSSQRYKHNIQTADWGLDAIRQLRPVTFNWNEDGRDGFGFIAEEAHSVNPLFAYSHNGQIEGVNYSELTSVLASGVQQLDVVVQTEKIRLDGVVNASQMQQATLSNLMAGMNGLEASISQVQSQITNATFATLNISGSASIQNLQVVNNLTVGNNLTVVNRISTRHLTVSGHIRTIGNAPTAELGILFDVLGQSIDVESAGISIEVAGNDTSGSISITTGSEALHLDGSYLLQVNFDQAFDTQPRVILAAANTAAAQARLHLDNALVTNQYFRILTLEELAPNTVYELNYFIVE